MNELLRHEKRREKDCKIAASTGEKMKKQAPAGQTKRVRYIYLWGVHLVLDVIKL